MVIADIIVYLYNFSEQKISIYKLEKKYLNIQMKNRKKFKSFNFEYNGNII